MLTHTCTQLLISGVRQLLPTCLWESPICPHMSNVLGRCRALKLSVRVICTGFETEFLGGNQETWDAGEGTRDFYEEMSPFFSLKT